MCVCAFFPFCGKYMISYGDTDAAPHFWNFLPTTIRLCQTVNQFKTQLKTYLLKKKYFANQMLYWF